MSEEPAQKRVRKNRSGYERHRRVLKNLRSHVTALEEWLRRLTPAVAQRVLSHKTVAVDAIPAPERALRDGESDAVADVKTMLLKAKWAALRAFCWGIPAEDGGFMCCAPSRVTTPGSAQARHDRSCVSSPRAAALSTLSDYPVERELVKARLAEPFGDMCALELLSSALSGEQLAYLGFQLEDITRFQHQSASLPGTAVGLTGWAAPDEAGPDSWAVVVPMSGLLDVAEGQAGLHILEVRFCFPLPFTSLELRESASTRVSQSLDRVLALRAASSATSHDLPIVAELSLLLATEPGCLRLLNKDATMAFNGVPAGRALLYVAHQPSVLLDGHAVLPAPAVVSAIDPSAAEDDEISAAAPLDDDDDEFDTSELASSELSSRHPALASPLAFLSGPSAVATAPLAATGRPTGAALPATSDLVHSAEDASQALVIVTTGATHDMATMGDPSGSQHGLQVWPGATAFPMLPPGPPSKKAAMALHAQRQRRLVAKMAALDLAWRASAAQQLSTADAPELEPLRAAITESILLAAEPAVDQASAAHLAEIIEVLRIRHAALKAFCRGVQSQGRFVCCGGTDRHEYAKCFATPAAAARHALDGANAPHVLLVTGIVPGAQGSCLPDRCMQDVVDRALAQRKPSSGPPSHMAALQMAISPADPLVSMYPDEIEGLFVGDSASALLEAPVGAVSATRTAEVLSSSLSLMVVTQAPLAVVETSVIESPQTLTAELLRQAVARLPGPDPVPLAFFELIDGRTRRPLSVAVSLEANGVHSFDRLILRLRRTAAELL
eukprot:m.57635 g.57635  ORF g.57635 m.57635 type:complete len:785 (+) comp6845_c0_seq2:155-2509(+)